MSGDASIAPVVPASNQMTSGSHDTLVQRLAMMLVKLNQGAGGRWRRSRTPNMTQMGSPSWADSQKPSNGIVPAAALRQELALIHWLHKFWGIETRTCGNY